MISETGQTVGMNGVEQSLFSCLRVQDNQGESREHENDLVRLLSVIRQYMDYQG